MRIEVATPVTASNKEKGDLLEQLACEVLRTQNYAVETQIRVTASELDLLCKHFVNQKKLYVECKAHREALSAGPLKQILGTIQFQSYDEAWLISTGPLGKDAKGFQLEWEEKNVNERSRLSIYTPERVIELLTNSGFVQPKPTLAALTAVDSSDSLGEWTFLITTFGLFWAVNVLESGVPTGVLIFRARDADVVKDTTLLRHLQATDTSLNTLDFEFVNRSKADGPRSTTEHALPNVVQVQSGEDWKDYRPARPEHFVGRKDAQDRLLHLFDSVFNGATRTRVFAVTGDSGMGKSSLVAKVRARCRNVRYRNKYFLFAVDVRAATSSGYIAASLLAAMQAATSAGFAITGDEPLLVSDHADPLASPSIARYFSELERQQKVLCLAFDQFEELYSKPELFNVFEEAQRLFLSAISACTSLILGFAWKTDSTVQQGHPAYFMWHRLADHRFEVCLQPFRHEDASAALTLFEKEIATKVRPELRRQIIENSQGFPWLIKKLCVHTWEQINSGKSQAELADTFDVASLFDRDLQAITAPENACLRSIARSAPADWYDILENYGDEVLRALQNRRLIVRSGDRLNLYWDIFKDYVLTNTVPSIPFTFLPSSSSLRAMLSVAGQLQHDRETNLSELTSGTSIGEGTVQNVIHDLLMFGVAAGSIERLRLDERIASPEAVPILQRIRQVVRRHALTKALAKFDHGRVIRLDDMIDSLKAANRAAQHRGRTWRLYAERMARWMEATGFLAKTRNGWIYYDRGTVSLPSQRARRTGVFLGEAPPSKVVDAITWLVAMGPQTAKAIKSAGYRNAAAVLIRLGMLQTADQGTYVLTEGSRTGAPHERLWIAADSNEVVGQVVGYLQAHPTASRLDLAEFMRVTMKQDWKVGSLRRIGTGIWQWAVWIIKGREEKAVPPVPKSRLRRRPEPDQGPGLFDRE